MLIVHINPIERPDVPTTARDILNRINEISFNSSLMREMRAIAFVTKLIDDGAIDEGKHEAHADPRHRGQDVMRELGVASKLNADWEFLTHLRDVGRERAERWLDENFAALNSSTSVDIDAMYL